MHYGENKLRIVLSFIFYPMAIGRFFENALRRRNDIDLVTIGPYSGSWIPWNGGMNVSQKYAKEPDIYLPFQIGMPIQSIPIGYAENLLPWQPDLWIQVDAGFGFIGRPSVGKNFIVGTDPHVLDYNRQRAYADRFFCMQTPYMKDGDIHLPYAFDPQVHFLEGQSSDHEKFLDVCLIGLHYPKRNQIVDRLRARGINVYYDLGPVFDEYRSIHNQAPIGINWSSKLDLNARVFELLAMRRLAIVNDVPDLPNFFRNGKDLVIVQSIKEAVEAAVYYLSDTELMNYTAQSGFDRVQEHTWDNRISQMLQFV